MVGKQQSWWAHNELYEGWCNHKKKYMITFSFMFINVGYNQHLPPVTSLKVGLLAIAKCLRSPSLCVSTGLCIRLPSVRTNSAIKSDHRHFIWSLYCSISEKVQNTAIH